MAEIIGSCEEDRRWIGYFVGSERVARRARTAAMDDTESYPVDRIAPPAGLRRPSIGLHPPVTEEQTMLGHRDSDWKRTNTRVLHYCIQEHCTPLMKPGIRVCAHLRQRQVAKEVAHSFGRRRNGTRSSRKVRKAARRNAHWETKGVALVRRERQDGIQAVGRSGAHDGGIGESQRVAFNAGAKLRWVEDSTKEYEGTPSNVEVTGWEEFDLETDRRDGLNAVDRHTLP